LGVGLVKQRPCVRIERGPTVKNEDGKVRCQLLTVGCEEPDIIENDTASGRNTMTESYLVPKITVPAGQNVEFVYRLLNKVSMRGGICEEARSHYETFK